MFDEIIDFLEAIENEANSIFLDEHTNDEKINLKNGPPTIASEARQLKKMFITLSE